MRGVNAPLLTCEAVLSEAHFLLGTRSRGGRAQLNALLTRGKLEVGFSLAGREDRVAHLMEQFADVPMSFADACLVCQAEDSGGTLVTTDRGFFRYRTSTGKRLSLLAPGD